VLEPEVLDLVPRGVMFSIERGVFPVLAEAGSLFGYVDPGYWRDIGTPESYLQAHFDILEGTVSTGVAGELGRTFLNVHPTAVVDAGAHVVPPSYVAESARVDAGARIGPLAVVGAGAVVAEGAFVVESVLQAGARIGAHGRIERSVIVKGAQIGAGTHVLNAIVGEGCRVGAGNQLAAGICLFPDTTLADNCIQFREQLLGREDR
jgi:mannose-1-phosphate guanylyltransferase